MINRKVNIIFSVMVFVCLLHTSLSGQRIAAKANRSRIFIGEQVILKLSVDGAHPGIAWFQFPDTLDHMEIVNRSKIDTITSGAFTNYQQNITITSFDSGRWQFPALAIAGINQVTMPVTIEVLPVDVSQKKDYNDIKDIEEVLLRTNPILIAILITLTLFALCMIIILVLQKKKSVIIKPVLNNNETPLQWALKALEKLAMPMTGSLPESKNYYTELNRISRSFFAMQLPENNRQLTTDEWMVNLNKLDIESGYKTPFFQVLRLSDSVRFAKYLPPSYENENAMSTIKNILQKASLLHSTFYSKYQPHQS